MGRIGANLSGIERTLLNRLAEANAAVTINSLRLATQQRVNSPGDDPSTFLALAGLQSRLTVVRATMSNVTAAGSMVSQAQTTLGQIRTQLNTIRTELLQDEDRSLSSSARAEAQANIDAAIAQINTLAGTVIGGRRLLDGSATFNVSGRNASNVAELIVHTAVDGSDSTISGTVLQAATRAQLVYRGASGQTTADATLTLTGELGSAAISVTNGEDLDDVAERINDQSHETGITASVDDDELTFTSVGYGSRAMASVVVGSGTFNVAGANTEGVAYGTDATAEVNGRTYSGGSSAESATLRHLEVTGTFANDAVIRVTGHLGSADITINNGDTLAQIAADISAESSSTGATAAVYGSELVISSDVVGSGAQLTIEVISGTFDTVTGYTGATQATLTHNEPTGVFTETVEFNLTGVVGMKKIPKVDAGKTLQEAADKINSKTADTGVEASVDGNDLLIQSVDTGPTAFATIEVLLGTFEVTGADGTGTAYGTNAMATAEGTDHVTGLDGVDGNRLSYNQNGLRFEIEFVAGFTGGFGRMTISGNALTFALSAGSGNRSTLAIPGLQPARLGGQSGTLDQVASGGSVSGLDDKTSQAIRIVDEALGDLDRIEGSVDGFYNAAITTSSNLLSNLQTDLEDTITQTDGYDENEEMLLLAKNLQLMSNAAAGLSILYQQRAGIVALIQKAAGLL